MRVSIRKKYATTTEREMFQLQKIARVLKDLLKLAAEGLGSDNPEADPRIRAGRRLLKEIT